MPEARCPCGHDIDDLCLNGVVYGNCGNEVCMGSCADIGTCLRLPGCCDPERHLT